MFKLDTSQLQAVVETTTQKLKDAAHDAAQAGIQVVYDRARLNAEALKSDKEHYFYGRNKRKYGPFQPGNLMRSIYQVYSKSESTPTKIVYQVSWNAKKAPYGSMVERGTRGKTGNPFMSEAIVSMRSESVRVMAERFAMEMSK
jgi:HK97 gp10 family phage protein